MPPCFMIARIERTRCWWVPMRPVTPLRMTPMVRVSIDLPFNSGAATLEDVHQLLEINLARVAARRLEQCSVGGAEVHAFLRGFPVEETVGESAGEAVAAADAVFDLQAVVAAALVENAVMPEDGGPVVHEAALYFAEGGADDFDIGVGFHHFLDHFLVGAGIERGERFIGPFDFKAEDFLEILFVADEAIDMGNEFLGDLLGLLAGPEFGAEIQVI